jgi:hypothetical protein
MLARRSLGPTNTEENPMDSLTTRAGPTAEQVAPLVSNTKQWMFGSAGSGQVLAKQTFLARADRNYWLKNRKVRKFLQYEHQDVGINLGWTDDAEPGTAAKVSRWFFALPNRADRAIRLGEPIAMGYGKAPSFVHYEVRDWGINLDWSTNPVYEWEVLGGRRGQPVPQDEYLAIYNRKAKRFFMYFDRNVGGEIGWDDSARWGTQLGDALRDLIEEYGDDVIRYAVMAALAA